MAEDNTGLAEPPAEVTTPATPAAEPTETPVEQQTPEAKAAEPEATPEPETAEETAQDEQTEERKKIPGSQKLKNRLRLIEADYEAATARAVELERKLQSLQQPSEGKPGVDREPRESDYPNDYFAYQDARMTWNSRQAIREELTRVQREQHSSKIEQQRREMLAERQEAYEESASLARERITDFDKVIRSATDIKITNQELVDEIMASDKAALIHYHLAKNPEKARELNSLSGKELAREVGRLETRLHLPQANKTTGAPPPPSSPKGGASKPYNPYTDNDMEAHVRWWNEQQKQIRA